MRQIFHTEPYKSYGVEEWASMPELELATLLRKTSCWAFNTQYLRPWLMHLYCIRKKNPSGRIPDHLDLMRVYGVKSKSAFLIMEGAMGIECGVVVDRHVKRSGFVPEGSKKGEEVNAMICSWLPSTECASFNETIGGICQIINDGNKNLVLQVEKDLSYKNIIEKFVNVNAD
jgi:endonuclease III